MEILQNSKHFPLTSYQYDIWIDQKIHCKDTMYNVGCKTQISGVVDHSILEKAINIVIERHDNFRITIGEKEGIPFQRFLTEIEYELPFLDFHKNKNPLEEFGRWIKEENTVLFNLNGNILFKMFLAKIKKDEYYLVTRYHHMIVDGWSSSITTKEILTVYNQIQRKKPTVASSCVSYTDFIEYNQKYLASDKFQHDRSFWKEKLKLVPEPMFSDKNFPMSKRTIANRETLKIKRNQFDKINRLLIQSNVTGFHFFLALSFLYFSRVYSKKIISIGFPLLNRGEKKHKYTSGLFINISPLILEIDENQTFTELMQTIKMQLFKIYRHQRLPLSEIDKLCHKTIQGHKELFELLVSYESHDYNVKMNNKDTVTTALSRKHELTCLSMHVRDYNAASDVLIDFDYQQWIFDELFSIDDMLEHFTYLINHANEIMSKTINQIDIYPPHVVKKLINKFNPESTFIPEQRSIIELFNSQVLNLPENIALIHNDSSITYRELNEKSNLVAHELINHGVCKNDIVGLLIDRGFDMIIGILAILKAGAAYLPIDPLFPKERIKFMLNDCQVNVVVTSGKYKNIPYFNKQILNIEELAIDEKKGSPDIQYSPDDLAYVMYTSGTTGNPKGTLICHKNVIRVVKDTNYIHFQPDDRFLQLSNYAFDGSVFDIYGALLNGCSLVLIDQDQLLDLDKLTTIISEKRITIFFITASLFNTIVEIDLECLKNVKKILFGGERASFIHVKKAFDFLGPNRLINGYGPTETTVFAAAYPVNEIPPEAETIPIGKGITKTSLYVLDSANHVKCIGIPGELCISGEGLSRGYINREDITDEKFVDNPFQKGEKMYRSGDIVRWLADGNIEYIGRIDNQVKIRGFRIEPEEIEAVIREYREVNNAVVTVIEEENTRKLCAYIVSGKYFELSGLKKFLRNKLPGYMMPTYFIELESLPLTSNGKIDQSSLPRPNANNLIDKDYKAPQNETEKILVDIWQNVLGIDKVGIQDDFYEIGGDSIKAIQIASQANELGLGLQVSDIFAYKTIKLLSPFVRKKTKTASQDILKGNVELSPIQRWFKDQEFENMHYFNQAFLLFSQKGFNLEAVQKVMSAIINHHDSLRLVLNKDLMGMHYQPVNQLSFKVEEIDLCSSVSLEEDIYSEGTKLQAGIDVFKGPLIKVGIYRTSDGDHLLIAIHHLIVDGVSWRILFEDFIKGYTQFQRGDKISFLRKSHSYKVWVEELVKYGTRKNVIKELDYWRNICAEVQNPMLHSEYIAKRCTFKQLKTISYMLDQKHTELLKTDVNRAFNTGINDILIAALSLAILKWSGQSKFLVNVENHGRFDIFEENNIDINRTVGWFTSFYPFLLCKNMKEDVGAHIVDVKEALRKVPAYGMGFNILRYFSNISEKDKRMLSVNPEIWFNFFGQLDGEYLKDIQFSPYQPGDSISSKNGAISFIGFNGYIINSELTFICHYDSCRYEDEKIEALVADFKESLITLIEYCSKKEETTTTPADFFDEKLSIDELDLIKRKLTQ